MKITKTAVALLAALALAGCGGSSSGTSGGGDYKTIDSIRAAMTKAGIDCTGYEQNKEVVGAREDGACQIGEDTASITIFNSADQRNQIRKATAALQSGINVDGGVWSVNVPTQELATKLQKALGGEIK